MSAKFMTQVFSRVCCAMLILGVCVSSAVAQQTLRVSASTQMTPLLKELATAFHDLHGDVTIEVNTQISSEAIKALREGHADIAAVSRTPTREELRFFHQVEKKQLIGTPIAMGAVALIVRPDNPLRAMSVQQARDVSLLGIYDWTKLDVTIDGSVVHEHSPTCNHPIKKGAFINLIVPLDGRDTLEYMRMNLKSRHHFPLGLSRLDSDEKIAHEVSFDANAIGLVSWSSYDGIRYVAIQEDAASEGILPTRDSIQSHAYPLSQYFYLYTGGEVPAITKSFLTFAISQEGQKIISLAGGVPLPMQKP